MSAKASQDVLGYTSVPFKLKACFLEGVETLWLHRGTVAAGRSLELADDGARQGPESLVREGGGDLGVVGLREDFADVFCWEDIYSVLVNPSGYENEEMGESTGLRTLHHRHGSEACGEHVFSYIMGCVRSSDNNTMLPFPRLRISVIH
jgi:hypothetical protein